MAEWDLLLRLAAAVLLGGIIGFEREMDEQPAGFRTHMLVSLGAALFTVAGSYGWDAFAGGDAEIRVDPTRIAAQIVTGIGFLGAGAIIQEGISVRGLTTAASLWVTAAIGMAVGFGAWVAAAGATALAIVALAVLKKIGYKLIPRATRGQTRLLVHTAASSAVSHIVRIAEDSALQVDAVKVTPERGGRRSIIMRLRNIEEGRLEGLVAKLSEEPGVEDIDWHR